ncbi:Tannase/feruloyl esterase [Truncatella angustata]|uniref:Carboxylic ester hydrolase n=1 Tax=Truncatella angustata TaxID=152316 RepID=A0A9P8UUD9_9PEZI|nr:Tannase/feruloyl esterase [Truncatella angustata]KAH6659319.1 Tannase/feruloyl esterase [Truncatella angustata]
MVSLATLLLALSVATRPVFASTLCNANFFSTLVPGNATIEKVAQVPSNGTYGEGILDLNYPTQPIGLPELCAVTVLVISSPESFYRFGLFLPTKWNSRFLAVGNGGFGGGINWLDMGAGVGYGFAVVSTDTGHNSVSTDVSWALNNAEKKTDWGWRSMHGTVVLAKQLVEAYYEANIAYSYYNGCSTGGRQGLKEVQISPDSFDGVIAGASSWYSSHLNPWVTKVGTYNLPVAAPNNIGAVLFPLMAAEALKQCDSLDGVSDGIISIPSQCSPDYTTLLCGMPGTNSSTCLTLPQIETANKVYADYLGSTGELLYPGLSPGCENQWFLVLNYTDTSPYGINFIRDFLYDDVSWYWTSYNDSVIVDAVMLNPGNATANDYDLSEFKRMGKKMIIYHGLADGLVPPKGSELYYKQVAETMTRGDVGELHDFFRYFEVPGMGHCWASSNAAPAPAFGGGSQASQLGRDVWSVPGFKNAQHDVLLAMMQWVENGTAVDSVVATTWQNSLDPSTPVARQRPLCPYPQLAIYDGVGDVDKASSWACG